MNKQPQGKLRSSLLQRQLRMQANQLDQLHLFAQECKQNVGWFKENNLDEVLASWRGYLKTTRKQIAKLDELQRFTKRELQEAYTIEQFERTWEPLPQEDDAFWLDCARMAREDGFTDQKRTDEIVAELAKMEEM